MAYLIVENFANGLDVRKSAFTAPPGTARRLVNAHITRGGEVEVRKAFALAASLPAGTTGLHSVREQLYVFGSEDPASLSLPTGINYQQLAHPTNPTASLARVLAATNFNGKIYALAEFTDGEVHHFYNGVHVTDWNAISGVIGSLDDVLDFLDRAISTRSDVTASVAGTVLTVTAATPGTPFTYSAQVLGGGPVNDQTFTAVETVANVEAVAEKLATGSFRISAGTVGGAAAITAITVNGVDILGATVNMVSNLNKFAADVVAQCNAFGSTPEYTVAVSASGNVISITALAGTGAGPNGFVIVVTTAGDAAVADYVNLAGGAAAVAAVAQEVEFTPTGTYEDDDTFSVTINDSVYSVSGADATYASYVKTFRDKVYAVFGSLMGFSGFRGDPPAPDPTAWLTTYTGAGVVNLVTQDEGAAELVSIGVYQNRLAFFGRRAVQIWSVDPDPEKNFLVQVLTNVGAVASRAVVSLGDIDLFFLSETGIRSLRARDSSNLASTQDVGTAIDSDVISHMRSLSADTISRACAVVDPVEGRVWISIGGRVYVFSHFPGSKVAAWSTYEPGFTIEDFATANGRVYCRSGNSVYLYGGATGEDYDEQTVVTVQVPFLDAGTPATTKTFRALDIGCEGTWQVSLSLSPADPDQIELVGNVAGTTYGLQDRFPVAGQSTHFSVTLTHTGGGYARLANMVMHYDVSEAG